jgi:amino acid transporter
VSNSQRARIPDSFVLANAGPLGIWTWPVVIVGQTFVAFVFGLLAARMPLAGYTYQWASRLANAKIGWLLGWFSFAFLVVDVVAVDYAVASTVLPALFNASWSSNQGRTRYGRPAPLPVGRSKPLGANVEACPRRVRLR